VAQNLTFNLGVDTNSAVSSINQFFQAFDQGAAQAQSKLNTAFGKPIKTEVQIVLSGADLAAKKVESMTNTSTKLKAAAKALNGEWGKTPAALQKQVQILNALKANTVKYSANTGKVTAEWKKVTQALAAAKNEAKKFNNESKKGSGGLVQKLIKANLAATAIEATFRAVVSGLQSLVQEGIEFQALSIQMEGFTGSAEAATLAFSEFADIAAGTPFNLKQVAQAGKILMAFGLDSQVATEETKRLGVIATATGGDLQLMARNLGQIAAQGQAYTRDLTQFAIQGIPIWQAMSDVTGQNVTQLKKMASEGQISFGIVQKAIKELTKEGSAYQSIYEKMQDSLQGKLAQVESAWQKLSQAVVDVITGLDLAMDKFLSGPLHSFINEMKWVSKNLPGILAGVLEGFQAWIGPLTLLTSLIGAVVGPAIIAALKGYIVKLGVQIAATWSAVKAQTALLLAMGPAGWGQAIIGASLFAAATIKIGEEASKAARALGEMQGDWDDRNEAAEALKDSMKETTAETEKQTASVKDQKKALEEAHKQNMANLKQQKEALKDAKDVEVGQIEDRKTKVKDAHEAKMNQIEAAQSRAKSAHEAHKAQIEAGEKAEQRRHELEMNAIQDEKELAEKANEARIAGIERREKKESSRHEKAMANIRAEMEAAESIRDKEVGAIDGAMEVAKESHDEKIAFLDAEIEGVEAMKAARIEAYEGEKAAAKAAFDAKMAGFKTEKTAADSAKEATINAIGEMAEREKSRHEARMAQIQAVYDREMAQIESKRNRLQATHDSTMAQLEQQRAAIDRRYDSEIARLDQRLSKIKQAYDLEMNRLNALTPAEKRLAEIRKAKLRADAQNMLLSEEERLNAQVMLDDMERQVKIKEATERMQKKEAKHAEKVKALEESRAAALERNGMLQQLAEQSLANQMAKLDAMEVLAQGRYDSAVKREENAHQKTMTNLETQRTAAETAHQAKLSAIESQETAARNNHETEMTRLKNEKDAAVGKYDGQIKSFEALKKKETEAHEPEITRLEEMKEAAEDKYIKTTEALEALEKKEQSGHQREITRLGKMKDAAKEKYEATQEAFEALEKEEKSKHEGEIERLGEIRDAAVEKYSKQDSAYEALKKKLKRENKGELSRLDGQKKAAVKKWEAQKDYIDKTLEPRAKAFYKEEMGRLDGLYKKVQSFDTAHKSAATGANNHATAVETAAGAYDDFTTSLNNAAGAWRNYYAAAGGSNSAPGSDTLSARASGGPVSGGSTYQVNELGKEAFLSASGRLSMINAPAFGEWRAPGAGTVIPAHLTKQLDIPTGGVDLNGATPIKGMDNNATAISRIAAAMGGNNVMNNSVSIQAANPVQAANNMMVEMARLRHRNIRRR